VSLLAKYPISNLSVLILASEEVEKEDEKINYL